MGAIVFLAIAAAFIVFRVWIISRAAKREDPPFIRYARDPRAATAAVLVITGLFALALALEWMPRWLGVVGLVGFFVAGRVLNQRAQSRRAATPLAHDR